MPGGDDTARSGAGGRPASEDRENAMLKEAGLVVAGAAALVLGATAPAPVQAGSVPLSQGAYALSAETQVEQVWHRRRWRHRHWHHPYRFYSRSCWLWHPYYGRVWDWRCGSRGGFHLYFRL
jgi:hypothetical protein